MKSFMWVPINSGNRSGSCSENFGFRIAQVVGCHSENGISNSENGISNSESCSDNTLGQKSCRTKLSRIFGIFVPDFVPNFAPNFPRIFWGLFVLRFVGDGDQKKIHQKSPPFFNTKFPGKHEIIIHKILLESRQSNDYPGTLPELWEWPFLLRERFSWNWGGCQASE